MLSPTGGQERVRRIEKYVRPVVGEGNAINDDALTVMYARNVSPTAKDDGGIAGSVINNDFNG